MRCLASRTVVLIAAMLTALADGIATASELDRDNLIFASSAESREIVAIDTGTDRIAMRYSLPARPELSLVAGDLGRLVTVSGAPSGIHIFMVDTGKPVRSIDPGFVVSVIQLSSDGKTLAAAGEGKIAFVDLSAAEITRVQRFDGKASAVVFDQEGQLLLVGDAHSGRIHIMGVGQSRAVDVLDLPTSDSGKRGIGHLARTPGGSTAMAIDGAGVATILDLKMRTAVKRIALPGRQDRIYPTINSQYFLVPNLDDASISIISTWTHAESERLRMRGDISDLNTVLADTVLFAFDRESEKMEVFDLDHRRRHRDIHLSGLPAATIVGPGGLKVYVALQGEDRIAVIDVRTLEVVGSIEQVGFSPTSIFDNGKLSYCH